MQNEVTLTNEYSWIRWNNTYGAENENAVTRIFRATASDGFVKA